MNQGQEFELCGKRNMPSGSALEYVMKRGGGEGIVLTAKNFVIWWRHWGTLSGRRSYMEERFSCAPITLCLKAFLRKDNLGQKLSMT